MLVRWEEKKSPCWLSEVALQAVGGANKEHCPFYSGCGGKASAGTLNYKIQAIWGRKYDSFDLDIQKGDIENILTPLDEKFATEQRC